MHSGEVVQVTPTHPATSRDTSRSWPYREGMKTKILVLGCALSVAVAVPSLANAEQTPPPPMSADAVRWLNEVYTPTPAVWQPKGNVVVETDFRPYASGFGFPNYGGSPSNTNNSVFGAPLDPVNANAKSLRDMVGPQVCREGNKTGKCRLTIRAAKWLNAANEASDGGHCFGLATTASMIAEGYVKAESFQRGVVQTYNLGLTNKLSRTISANFARQFTSAYTATSPSKVVEQLQTGLGSSGAPFVLVITGAEGGHAITPYALLDRGQGIFDIAVYDNNYPGTPRAVHVDTNTNTWEYSVMTRPGEPEMIWSEQIGLTPVKKLAAQQKCPFCAGANRTTVQIDSVVSDVPLKVKVRKPNGKRLKGVKVSHPTNPWRAGEEWTFPGFSIPKGKSFVLRFNNKHNPDGFQTDVLTQSGDFTMGVTQLRIPVNGVGAVGLKPRTGLVVYDSPEPDIGNVQFAEKQANGSFVHLVGSARGKSERVILGQIDEAEEQVTYTTASGRAGKVHVKSILQPERGRNVKAVIKNTLPKDADLVVDYSEWSPKSKRGLGAWIEQGDTKTAVNVRLK